MAAPHKTNWERVHFVSDSLTYLDQSLDENNMGAVDMDKCLQKKKSSCLKGQLIHFIWSRIILVGKFGQTGLSDGVVMNHRIVMLSRPHRYLYVAIKVQ